jgi:PAS domain
MGRADDDHEDGAASLTGMAIRRERTMRVVALPTKRGDLTRKLAKRRLEAQDEAPVPAHIRHALAAMTPGPERPPPRPQGRALQAAPVQPAATAQPGRDPATERPAAKPPAAAEASRAASPQTAPSKDIYAFWSLQRQGRPFPARADIDPGRVAELWPNSLVLRVRSDAPGLELDPGFAASKRQGRAVVFTPMVLDWVLGLGRKVGQTGEAVTETAAFPHDDGTLRYRAVALPLGETQGAIDHILCNIDPA